MGGAGGKNAAPPLSLIEVFERALPNYLAFGMSYEQFWDGDVSAHKAFREAYRIRLRERNQLAWLQGMYIYEAIADLAPVLKAFAKGRARPYCKEPYPLFEDDKRRSEEEEQKERYEKMREKVAAFAKAFNEKKQKEREVDSDAGCVD